MAALAFWIAAYDKGLKIRTFTVALIWTFIEYFLNWLSRGQGFTSLARFIGNLVYIPFCLDFYGWIWLARDKPAPILYVALFPLNMWLLEIVLSRAFKLVYGRNVAWCYINDWDNLFKGTVR